MCHIYSNLIKSSYAIYTCIIHLFYHIKTLTSNWLYFFFFCFSLFIEFFLLVSCIHKAPPITTDVVSSNLDQGEVYNIMWWSFSVTCDRSVIFSGSSAFLYQLNWYNWNIVESGVNTVVKELRSKMFGQHPGYFKAVCLKKTQIIIVSIYEYTVYIRFWIMMLYDCYYY